MQMIRESTLHLPWNSTIHTQSKTNLCMYCIVDNSRGVLIFIIYMVHPGVMKFSTHKFSAHCVVLLAPH